MRTITLPWESWRAIIAALREKAVPYMLDHANVIGEQLERHGPDEPTVWLSLTDEVFLRSSTWARWQLGIPLPADGRGRWGYTSRPHRSPRRSPWTLIASIHSLVP
jgi:hypothetical protein